VADAVTTEIGVDAAASRPPHRADGGGDVASRRPDACRGDAGGQRALGCLDQPRVVIRAVADGEGDRGVRGPAVEDGAAVDAEQVAVA